MKTTLFKPFSLAFIFSFLIFSSNALAEDISFSIEDVSIEATVKDNGDMDMKETFVYDIDFMNGMLRTINDSEKQKIIDFSAREISPHNEELDIMDSKTSKGVEYKIFRKASNEEVTFELNYTIKNAVERYNDTASLYWKFFDKDNKTPFKNLNVEINFPQKVNRENAKIFAHDKLNSNISFTSDGTVLYKIGKLPPNNMTEVRILFPEDFVPSSNIIKKDMKDEILKEELNWAKNTKNEALAQTIFKYIIIIAITFNILTLIYIYFNYDKEIKVKKIPYFRGVPSNLTPAIVSYLLNDKKVSKDSITSILLDLTRRKYLSFKKEVAPPKKGLFKKMLAPDDDYIFTIVSDAKGLKRHEKHLLEFLFSKIGDGRSFSTNELEKYSSYNRYAMSNFFDSWQKIVVEDGDKYKLFEEPRPFKNKFNLITVIGIIVFGLSILMYHTWISYLLALTSLFVSTYYHSAQKRTSIGINEHERWKGFERYLKDFGKLNEKPAESIIIWEHYLVYATVFGIASKVLKQIEITIPNLYQDHNSTYLHSFSSRDGFNFSPLSNLTDSLGSNFSPPSTGSGGSSSSGGGGGGGGGGAGGF